MIQGLGTDLIEIGRIRKSVDRYGTHFLDRLFTKTEQDYCLRYKDPIPHLAGRFAAKEAVAKALGTGFGAELRFRDIEIVNDPKGKPIVILSQKIEKQLGIVEILLSITHTKEHAFAVAISKREG
ncbi:MAG TPA: holo-ACP synthase [Chlamydiales bacterium]|nr:holo-ACP synthase [Chlamydiales bacterium]